SICRVASPTTSSSAGTGWASRSINPGYSRRGPRRPPPSLPLFGCAGQGRARTRTIRRCAAETERVCFSLVLGEGRVMGLRFLRRRWPEVVELHSVHSRGEPATRWWIGAPERRVYGLAVSADPVRDRLTRGVTAEAAAGRRAIAEHRVADLSRPDEILE